MTSSACGNLRGSADETAADKLQKLADNGLPLQIFVASSIQDSCDDSLADLISRSLAALDRASIRADKGLVLDSLCIFSLMVPAVEDGVAAIEVLQKMDGVSQVDVDTLSEITFPAPDVVYDMPEPIIAKDDGTVKMKGR